MPPALDLQQLNSTARARLVQRADLDIRSPGKAVITKLVAGPSLRLTSSTGVDAGTGDVTLSLAPTGVPAGTYNKVKVDEFGRVVQGWVVTSSSDGGTSSNTKTIANQSLQAQDASFWIAGTARVDGALRGTTATFDSVTVTTLSMAAPLGVAYGGTGVNVAPPHTFFGGSTGTHAYAPAFRTLQIDDLPAIPFNHVIATPTSLAGYGIIDAYSKQDADATFVKIGTTDSRYELSIPMGSTTQYWRGDKTWQILNADAVPETVSNKYFNDYRFDVAFGNKSTDNLTEGLNKYWTANRSRAALSALGTNLAYDATTGVFQFSNAPTFGAVTLASDPVSPMQVTTKAYVDAQIAAPSVHSTDSFTVVSSSVKSYNLSNSPIFGSVIVSLNGLLQGEGSARDYTIAGQIITYNGDAILTPGDVIDVSYTH